MDYKQVLEVFKHNAQETIGLEDLEHLERNINIYWGCAPTKVPSLAYLVPLLKLRECFNTGRVNITIFLADMHSYMDKGFDEIARMRVRTDFYQFILTLMMRLVGFNDNEYRFVRGSSVQLTPGYMRSLLEFTTLTTVRDAQHAGKEVVKDTKQPTLSSLLYPLMQCLDERALDADIQLGGMDQRKIFMLSRDFMPRLGLNKCAYIMNPIIPSLIKGEKMSSSIPNGKIGFYDTDSEITEKIRKAFCADKDTNLSTNPCLSIMKYIVFPLKTEENYEKFEKEWAEGKFDARELKNKVTTAICEIVEKIRKDLYTVEGVALYSAAYA